LYAPSIYTVYFKRLTANGISERAGCPWFYAATSLPANLQPKNVHGCTFLGEDGGGSTQKILGEGFPLFGECCGGFL